MCHAHLSGINQVLLNQLSYLVTVTFHRETENGMDTEAWIAAGWDPADALVLVSVQKLASYTCMCSAYTLHGSLALILFRAHIHARWKKLQWWEQMSIMQIHKCPRL